MAGYCQSCGKNFEEPGPLCRRCLPEGCNIAGLSALGRELGIAVRGKPFSRQHIFNLTCNSVFAMPVVGKYSQAILCTHVNSALSEFLKTTAEGNSRKALNLPQFRTAVSSC